MASKRKLVIVRSRIQASTWLGEMAMAGARINSLGLFALARNGDEIRCLIIPDDERAYVLRSVTCDDYDITRLHPVASPYLLGCLEACKRPREDNTEETQL